MARYHVRALRSADFATLDTLEREVFGAAGEAVLCPHYLRLCTEFFPDSSFLVFDQEKPVGYKDDNLAARLLHQMLGAREVERRRDFYGPGDDRIVSRIDREAFEKLRARYQRLESLAEAA